MLLGLPDITGHARAQETSECVCYCTAQQLILLSPINIFIREIRALIIHTVVGDVRVVIVARITRLVRFVGFVGVEERAPLRRSRRNQCTHERPHSKRFHISVMRVILVSKKFP